MLLVVLWLSAHQLIGFSASDHFHCTRSPILVYHVDVASSVWNQNHIPIKGCVSRNFVILKTMNVCCFYFSWFVLLVVSISILLEMKTHNFSLHWIHTVTARTQAQAQAHLYVRFIVLFVLHKKKIHPISGSNGWHVYVLFDFGWTWGHFKLNFLTFLFFSFVVMVQYQWQTETRK